MKSPIKSMLTLMTFVISLFISFFTFISCQNANATDSSTQNERIEASVANDKHQAELGDIISSNKCMESINDSNPIIGTIEMGTKTYEVHQGPRGGLYVWKIRTRDTSAGTKGSCYKQSIPAERRHDIKQR